MLQPAELAREEHVWIGASTVNCILVPPGTCHGSTQLVNNDVKYNFSRIETAEDKLAGPIVRWGTIANHGMDIARQWHCT